MTFLTPYGTVKLSAVWSGYQGWMVFLDDFYQGVIQRTDQGLVFYPGPGGTKIQGDDLAGLMEVLTEPS